VPIDVSVNNHHKTSELSASYSYCVWFITDRQYISVSHSSILLKPIHNATNVYLYNLTEN